MYGRDLSRPLAHTAIRGRDKGACPLAFREHGSVGRSGGFDMLSRRVTPPAWLYGRDLSRLRAHIAIRGRDKGACPLVFANTEVLAVAAASTCSAAE